MPGSGGSVGPWLTQVARHVGSVWLTLPPGRPMAGQDIPTLTLVHHLSDLRLAQCRTLVSRGPGAGGKSDTRPFEDGN